MYCFICGYLDPMGPRNTDVVAICCKHNRAVCAEHAAGCVEDGHGTRPIEPRGGE